MAPPIKKHPQCQVHTQNPTGGPAQSLNKNKKNEDGKEGHGRHGTGLQKPGGV